MDIYLSVNNREEVLKIPVLPSSFTVSKPKNNSTFETATGEELKRIGKPGLKTISWESFFPIRDYPFLRDTSYKGHSYVYILDTWYLKRLPIRLIITDTPINMAVTIENFDYTIKQDGDLWYSIELCEFPLITTG